MRHIGAGEQFVGSGAQDLQHRLVEAGQRPALRQPPGQQPVDLVLTRIDAAHHVVEEGHIGIGVAFILYFLPQPVLVKFVEQFGERSALHLPLVERLHRREARSGSSLRARGHGRTFK